MELTDRVKEFIKEKGDRVATEFMAGMLELLEYYNEQKGREIISPVEQLFYIEWSHRNFMAHERDALNFILTPQFQDKSTGKYKIDFRLDFVGYLINYQCDRFSEDAMFSIPEPLIGIEIDGHIWHEKTKEQVQYHKERERFLVSRGWTIYRFTGSEVYNDPAKCLNELQEKTAPLVSDWWRTLRKFDGKGK